MDNKYYKTFFLLHLPISIMFGGMMSVLLLWGSKTAWGMILVLFIFIFFISVILKIGIVKAITYALYFIIATIPFPYLIKFGGRDAMTITTFMIYFIFALLMLYIFVEKKKFKILTFEFMLPFLIFVNLTLSLFFNPIFIGQSIRFYISNLSGILLYSMVLATVKKRFDVILVTKIIMLTLVFQFGIALLQLKYPNLNTYFMPFAAHARTPIDSFIRTTGTMWDYELLAEWFLIGIVLSILLIYETTEKKYYFSLLCCAAGIVFTKTRSVLFLFVFIFIVIYILLNVFKRTDKRIFVKIILLSGLGCVILAFIFPRQINKVVQRLVLFFLSPQWFSAAAINRKETWGGAINLLLSQPTVFGRGLYNIETLYYWAESFHSLYLTILFNLGFFGLVIHVSFYSKMLKRSWSRLSSVNKSKNWNAVFFLFIILIIIIIDGIKIEYLRYGHTIQFAWLIYALLITSLRNERENDENLMVS